MGWDIVWWGSAWCGEEIIFNKIGCGILWLYAVGLCRVRNHYHAPHYSVECRMVRLGFNNHVQYDKARHGTARRGVARELSPSLKRAIIIKMNEQENLLKKKIRLHRWHIITNIILIIVFLAIGIYIFSEIENFKLLSSDICRLCAEKTGATFCPTVKI